MKWDPSAESRSQTAASVSRRTFLRMVGGGVAFGLLASCAPSAPGGAPDVAPTVANGGAKGVVLKELGADYLAYPDVKGTVQFSNCWGGARIPLVEKWIKSFNAIYPNIKIENDVGDCPPLRDKQVSAIAAGAPPNVMMVKSDNAAFYADQGAILPLDDLMKRDGVKPEWFYPAEFKSRTWQGKTYGLPNATAGALHLLFVNTKLLERVGWDPKKPVETWQDLEALVEPAKKQGLFVMDPAKVSTGQTMHFVLTYANGGQYWDDDLTKVRWNEPPGVEAAEWLLKFVKAQAGKYENLAIASDRKNVIEVEHWAPEKYVAMINLTSRFFDLPQKAPRIKYATYTFPRNAGNPASKGNVPTTGGWMFSIAKAGKDQDAAWEWVKYTTLSDDAVSFFRSQNRPSALVRGNEDPALQKQNPFWSVVIKDLSTNVNVPTSGVHPQLMQIWYDMEDAILFEKMQPKEALDSYAKRGQALLDEWNAKRKKS